MAYENITPLVRPVMFVMLGFDSEPLRVNTTPVDLEWDGETWLGAGILGAITAAEQNIEMSATSLSLTLAGVPVDRITEARSELYRNRPGEIYLGLFDDNWELSDEPRQIFAGDMDSMSIVASGDSASITVELTSPLSDWERAKLFRYTHEAQTERFPGDLGLEFIPRMAEVVLPWGVPSN